MPINSQEAAGALNDIDRGEQHSAVAYRYQRFSPHFFVWGVIWMIGYAVPYFRPGAWKIWLALIPVGILATIWIDKRSRRSRGWNYGVECLAIFLFIYAVYTILPPKSTAQGAALFPLVIALVYVFLGISTRAARVTLLGFVLGALTVGGFFWLPHYFLLWMAGVGGGALILGGFWLRRI